MVDIFWPCVDFTVECEYRVVEWLGPLLLSGSAVNTHTGPRSLQIKVISAIGNAQPLYFLSSSIQFLSESFLTWYSISASLSRKLYHHDRNSLQELLLLCHVLNSPNIESDYAFTALEVETSQAQKTWTLLKGSCCISRRFTCHQISKEKEFICWEENWVIRAAATLDCYQGATPGTRKWEFWQHCYDATRPQQKVNTSRA